MKIEFYFFLLQVLCQTPQDKTQTWDILHTHKLPRLFIVSKFICFQNSNAAGLRQKKGWCMVWSKSCRKWSEKSSPYVLQWFDMKKLKIFRNHTIALKCIQTTFFLIIFCNFYSTPYTILSLPVSSGIIILKH